MKNYFFLILTVFALSITACKRDAAIPKDAALEYIPADASQISIIRLPQILEKIDFESLKNEEFYKNMISAAADRDPIAPRILQNPQESGINIQQNAYLITDINPSNTSDMLNAMVFNIGDVAKFEELVKAADLDVGTKKGNGYQYNSNDVGFVAWNDKIAVAGSKTYNLSNKLDKIFNGDASTSVLSNSGFESTAAGNYDINYFFSSDALAETQQAAMASFIGISKDDLKGNYIKGGVNFEDKVMKANFDFDLKPAIGNDLNMPFKSSVETDFSPYIPGENLSGLFTFGFNTRGLVQLLKEKNALEFISNAYGLNQLGLDAESIAKAIDGDMFLAVQQNGSEGKPAGIFGITINETEFAPFLKILVDSGSLIDEGNGTYKLKEQEMARSFHESLGGTGDANEAKAIIKDGILFISADPNLLAAVNSGGLPKGKRVDGGLYKEISSGFLGGKAFPDQLTRTMEGLEIEGNEEIEYFVFSAKQGNAQLQVKSKKDGNFLKNIILDAANQQ